MRTVADVEASAAAAPALPVATAPNSIAGASILPVAILRTNFDAVDAVPAAVSRPGENLSVSTAAPAANPVFSGALATSIAPLSATSGDEAAVGVVFVPFAPPASAAPQELSVLLEAPPALPLLKPQAKPAPPSIAAAAAGSVPPAGAAKPPKSTGKKTVGRPKRSAAAAGARSAVAKPAAPSASVDVPPSSPAEPSPTAATAKSSGKKKAAEPSSEARRITKANDLKRRLTARFQNARGRPVEGSEPQTLDNKLYCMKGVELFDVSKKDTPLGTIMPGSLVDVYWNVAGTSIQSEEQVTTRATVWAVAVDSIGGQNVFITLQRHREPDDTRSAMHTAAATDLISVLDTVELPEEAEQWFSDFKASCAAQEVAEKGRALAAAKKIEQEQKPRKNKKKDSQRKRATKCSRDTRSRSVMISSTEASSTPAHSAAPVHVRHEQPQPPDCGVMIPFDVLIQTHRHDERVIRSFNGVLSEFARSSKRSKRSPARSPRRSEESSDEDETDE